MIDGIMFGGKRTYYTVQLTSLEIWAVQETGTFVARMRWEDTRTNLSGGMQKEICGR